jgi:hypothetical protein
MDYVVLFWSFPGVENGRAGAKNDGLKSDHLPSGAFWAFAKPVLVSTVFLDFDLPLPAKPAPRDA